MDINKIKQKVDGIPYMSYAQALVMTDFILSHQFQNILELGFARGVSTCYIAGALDELGRGTITTIDLEGARNHDQNIYTLLGELDLTKYVTAYFEPTSYVWRLMKMIEENPSPRFDFCYIDGAHSWFVDGFAFLLVDKLLQPGGWIIFDDLDWTYGTTRILQNTTAVLNMPFDEKSTPQIRKVYELLVQTHPDYGDFIEKDGWAYAHKISSQSGAILTESKTITVYQEKYIGPGNAILYMARKISRMLGL